MWNTARYKKLIKSVFPKSGYVLRRKINWELLAKETFPWILIWEIGVSIATLNKRYF